MSNPDVFNTDKPIEPVVVDEVDTATLLSSITNEAGEPKYDSIEKALVALKHSQDHIKTLEASSKETLEKMTTLEVEAKKAKELEESLTKLKAADQSKDTNNPVDKSVDENAVKSMVESLLTAREESHLRSANRAQVAEKISQAYGDKTFEVLANKAKELNTTVEALGALSETNPAIVLNLIVPGGGNHSVPPTTSTIRVPAGVVDPKPLERPTKSLLSGATAKEQAEFMKRVKEEVYRKFNVETT